MRFTTKLQHTAALLMPAANAATIASNFSPVIACGRPPMRPRRLASRQTSNDTLPNQGAFVLGECSCYTEQQFTGRRSGIHALGERNATPLILRSVTIVSRCDRDRPRRSSFQNTRTSPGRMKLIARNKPARHLSQVQAIVRRHQEHGVV